LAQAKWLFDALRSLQNRHSNINVYSQSGEAICTRAKINFVGRDYIQVYGHSTGIGANPSVLMLIPFTSIGKITLSWAHSRNGAEDERFYTDVEPEHLTTCKLNDYR